MCRIICFLACRFACSVGVIHACKWPLRNPTNVFVYGFQGMFNANVFSVLAVHIESKMIIFTSEMLQVLRLFQVNFAYDYAFVWKMAVPL